MNKDLISRILKILKDPKRAYVYTGCIDQCIDCGGEERHRGRCDYQTTILELEGLLSTSKLKTLGAKK